jgi:hypothetical protein
MRKSLFCEEKDEMDIKRSVSITITPDEIKQIITRSLKEEGYDIANCAISFNVKNECEGYGMMEHEVTRFRGATVEIN